RQARLVQRLGRIIDDSANEVFVFSASTWRYTQVSRAALENLGYTAEEMEALGPLDVVAGATRERLQELVDALLSGREDHFSYTTTHRRKDGTTYPAMTRLQLSAVEDPPVLVAICQDITEQQRAERMLERLGRIVDAATDETYIIDAASLRLVQANASARRNLGYDNLQRVP